MKVDTFHLAFVRSRVILRKKNKTSKNVMSWDNVSQFNLF